MRLFSGFLAWLQGLSEAEDETPLSPAVESSPEQRAEEVEALGREVAEGLLLVLSLDKAGRFHESAVLFKTSQLSLDAVLAATRHGKESVRSGALSALRCVSATRESNPFPGAEPLSRSMAHAIAKSLAALCGEPEFTLRGLEVFAWLVGNWHAEGVRECAEACLDAIESDQPAVGNFATWLLSAMCTRAQKREREFDAHFWNEADLVVKKKRLLSRVGSHLGNVLRASRWC